MNKELIQALAITGGIYDCITDPYDKLKNGDPYSSVMIDLERFAEKIVQECIDIVDKTVPPGYADYPDYRDQIEKSFRTECADVIMKHFGVEE